MLSRLTIRQRILATFIVIVLAGGVVQLLIAGQQLQSTLLEFYQHHLETDALLVTATFSEPFEKYLEGEGTSGMQWTLATLQQKVGHDYLIVDHNFSVIGYTANAGSATTSQVAETPELLQAKTDRIGADIRPAADGQDYLYVAVAIQYENEILGYLVLSEPMQPAYTEINQRWLELASATLPVVALVIAASLWISGTISRPIQKLRNSALKMAQGALDTRIEIASQDEVGQLAQTFNYMAGQIEMLIKAQRSFVSNAAHELRTPLMTLKLRAEALADETLPAAEQETYLGEIRQEIDHMAELVSSLLVLARIDEGRHSANGTVTDTTSTLHDIARHWRIESEKAGLHFAAEIASQLPELPLSPNDLRLVLDNLLGNAIKYTPQGALHLQVSQDAQAVWLEVTDTGIGFTPEQGLHLFDRFYRSEQARGQFPGNGLGLSIVKAILEQYGGQIEGHSPGSGHGTTFKVRLPKTPDPTSQAPDPLRLPDPPTVPDGWLS
ncbi:MAG TPA: HAMP domain-containing sensor histidine kinase [Phototrophicaceae bacterium]|nr:HAMP domain-containing sensor histidine kinase [Phototrophicaceae bacterium]